MKIDVNDEEKAKKTFLCVFQESKMFNVTNPEGKLQTFDTD